MFQGFLLPRGSADTPQARVVRFAARRPLPDDLTRRFTVRLAEAADEPALRRLAGLDDASVPAGTLLVGEMGGAIQAAVPVAGGRGIANPFVRTAELLTLLELRAAQLRRLGVDDHTGGAVPLLGRWARLAGRIA